MDLAFYSAAAEGKIQVFKDAQRPLDVLVTPNQNTILHIYITSLNNTELESTTEFVKEVLDICPPLLGQCNTKGETPLHIAARFGHAAMVKVLIDRLKTDSGDLEGKSQVDSTKEMLRMKNKRKDTALHEAVRYNHLDVVKLLLTEDPDFVYFANQADETLLYVAVERGFKNVASEILKTCNSAAYTGPLGRTALHAAAIQDDAGMVREILLRIGGLAKQADKEGFTPLHLAAGFGCLLAVEVLLEFDREAAYMKDDEGRIALHIAAYEGKDEIVEKIVSLCPDCCELVDNKGWNALHFSVASPKDNIEHVVNLFVRNPSLKNLLDEEDSDGNTPFLLHSKTVYPLFEKLANHPSVDKMAFNDQNLSALDLVMTKEIGPARKRILIKDAIGYGGHRKVSFRGLPRNWDEEWKEYEDWRKLYPPRLERVAEYHLVVAALITTVTFAAGITVPGGFLGQDSPHPGSAILAGSSAFKAFVITDTISMLLSTVAVLSLMFLPTLSPSDETFGIVFRLGLIKLAFFSTLVALGAMVLAFVTGTFAVLAHHSLDLAIATCIVGLCFFPILFFMFAKWVRIRRMTQ